VGVIDLAVFLGNPGNEYAGNRHNAGWLLAEVLPFYFSLNWQKKYKGLYAAFEGPPLGRRVHFLKPATFMNLSGEAAAAAAAFFKIKPESILVVQDELELLPGTISLKFGGGLGGHNGLRSMKASFGTADFWRLRIGIGRPGGRKSGEGGPPMPKNPDVYAWVLSDFTAGEWPVLDAALKGASELLIKALTAEPETLLKEWAKRSCYVVSE
jgi:PTH1 family peptidyl-tRNA hydrolase